MSYLEPLKYEELKDVYKVEKHSKSLFNYLLHNNEFNSQILFHELTKEELIKNYEELTKKHLDILKSL